MVERESRVSSGGGIESERVAVRVTESGAADTGADDERTVEVQELAECLRLPCMNVRASACLCACLCARVVSE